MKLIPFLRFGGSHGNDEDTDTIDLPPNELVELPTDEEEQTEDEEKPEEEKTEESEDKHLGNDDDMLKVFMSVDEDFVDNSGLTSQIDDVPVEELVQEARVIASAFGIRVTVPEDEAV